MSTAKRVVDFEVVLQRLLFSADAETYFATSPSFPEWDGPAAQTAFNGLAPLKSNNTDSVFRNFAAQLDTFAQQTHMAGIPYLNTTT